MFKELAKSIVIYGLSSSLGKFIGLFFVPIYTRIFSPEEYGIIDVISVTISFISILGILQLESAISRFYYSSKDSKERNSRISTAMWTTVFVSFSLVFILILLSDFISNIFFESSEYAIIISIASFLIPLSNLFAIFTVIIRFLKKPGHYTLIVLIQLAVTISVSVLMVVYLDKGIIGVFVGQLSGLALGVLIGAIYLRGKIHFIFNMGYLKEMFQYSLPMVPAVAGGWINSNANRYVMIGYLSLSEIGLYAVALKIASVMKIVDSAIRMAWGPFFWETYERENHRVIFQRVSVIITMIIFTLVIVISLFSSNVLMILTPMKFHAASQYVGLVALAFGLNIINQTIGVGPGITKKTYYNTGIYFFSVTINIGALFLLVPQIGLLGVPISLFMSAIVLLILAWYFSERLYFIGFSKTMFGLPFALTTVIVFLNTFFDYSIQIKLFICITIIAICGLYILKRGDSFNALLSEIEIGGKDN
jgi:O-antigen/teichoic acid export membrane protein